MNIFCQIFYFRCAIPGYDNDTYEVQSEYHQMLINKTIPPPTDDKFLYHACHVYTNGSGYYDSNNKPINATEESCSKWVYDKTDFDSTFTSKVTRVKTNFQLAIYLHYQIYNSFKIQNILNQDQKTRILIFRQLT